VAFATLMRIQLKPRETLPKPNTPADVLKEIPVSALPSPLFRYGRQRQTWSPRQGAGGVHKREEAHAVIAADYALYNPPWTLHFLRRNEVMVETAGPRD
jgi:hypothetical protein